MDVKEGESSSLKESRVKSDSDWKTVVELHVGGTVSLSQLQLASFVALEKRERNSACLAAGLLFPCDPLV